MHVLSFGSKSIINKNITDVFPGVSALWITCINSDQSGQDTLRMVKSSRVDQNLCMVPLHLENEGFHIAWNKDCLLLK